MKKVIAGSAVGAVAALLALGFSTPAQAYPDNTPPTEILPQGPSEAAPASSKAALPNTGGPDETLLLGGLGLVVGGGAALVVARRRRESA